MECGECEMDMRAGHAPDCSRRCQVINGEDQCEHGTDHKGTHGVYGPDESDGIIREWPARLGEPTRGSWAMSMPTEAVTLGPGIAYTWKCGTHGTHEHTIDCLWIWHDCTQILGPTSVAPGQRFGWRPSGVGAHTLVAVDPLTITASVIWPECCGRHGFITNAAWSDV